MSDTGKTGDTGSAEGNATEGNATEGNTTGNTAGTENLVSSLQSQLTQMQESHNELVKQNAALKEEQKARRQKAASLELQIKKSKNSEPSEDKSIFERQLQEALQEKARAYKEKLSAVDSQRLEAETRLKSFAIKNSLHDSLAKAGITNVELAATYILHSDSADHYIDYDGASGEVQVLRRSGDLKGQRAVNANATGFMSVEDLAIKFAQENPSLVRNDAPAGAGSANSNPFNGGGAPGSFSLSDIKNMSREEYRKNRDAISAQKKIMYNSG